MWHNDSESAVNAPEAADARSSSRQAARRRRSHLLTAAIVRLSRERVPFTRRQVVRARQLVTPLAAASARCGKNKFTSYLLNKLRTIPILKKFKKSTEINFTTMRQAEVTDTTPRPPAVAVLAPFAELVVRIDSTRDILFK